MSVRHKRKRLNSSELVGDVQEVSKKRVIYMEGLKNLNQIDVGTERQSKTKTKHDRHMDNKF